MNVRYLTPGTSTDCFPEGNLGIDFSRGEFIQLDENALNESAGVCGNFAVDWNGNGVIDPGLVVADINRLDGLYTSFTDFDDWAFLIYRFEAGVGGGEGVEVITCSDYVEP
jgi:hypothetical protein